jgi:hypothetical protein
LVLVGLVFPVLAVLAGAQTLAIVVESQHPNQATVIAPWDGSVRAHLAKAAYRGQLAANPATVEPPTEWMTTLAMTAYKHQPLVPGALAVIGAAREREKAVFWNAAANISRRDTLLQGLLLNFYVQNKNPDRTIRVLNQILLVRVEQRPAVFAALTQALRDPRSIDTFVDILSSGPNWADGFLAAARYDKEALVNLGIVRERLPDGVIDPSIDRALVDAFASSGQLERAYDLYARLSAQRSSDTDGWSSEIPPFDWVLVDEPGFRAQVVGGSEQLQLNVARGKGGTFASRIFPARSRSLSIRGQHDIESEQQAERLEVAVACAGGGSPFAQANFDGGKITLDAAIPSDCSFVEIALSGRAWSYGQRITGSIAPLTIATND